VPPPRDVCGSDDDEGRLLFRPVPWPPPALGILAVALAALGLGLQALWEVGGFLTLAAGVLGLGVAFGGLAAGIVALWRREGRRRHLRVAGLALLLGALAMLIVLLSGMRWWASNFVPY
jgi:hypothetical protein